MLDKVQNTLKDMLDSGEIRPSQSPWCNVVVLVRKKDRSLCFCIDFQRLNNCTKKDSFPLPQIQEAVLSLVGACHFSCLDHKLGFWQIQMSLELKQYMAFIVGNLGFYDCEWMLFRLCNALATFQQLMQNCLGELKLTFCIIYLDDIIMYSKMESEHLHCLHMVFTGFCKHNLKLKPSKCNYFWQEITYLAHHVSWTGVRSSRENVQAIIDFPLPDTYSKIWAFLGLSGNYRQFIKNFAYLAEPLHKYLNGEGASWKSEGLHLSMEARWTLKKIKRKLINAPVLAFADYTEPFCLEMDASKEGLHVVLSQKQSNVKYHPIAFASRTLNNHEENYHSLKLEFLVLKWAITEHFKEYLMMASSQSAWTITHSCTS